MKSDRAFAFVRVWLPFDDPFIGCQAAIVTAFAENRKNLAKYLAKYQNSRM
jgi:hypothetical protein